MGAAGFRAWCWDTIADLVAIPDVGSGNDLVARLEAEQAEHEDGPDG